jgi:hypothetical protein
MTGMALLFLLFVAVVFGVFGVKAKQSKSGRYSVREASESRLFKNISIQNGPNDKRHLVTCSPFLVQS